MKKGFETEVYTMCKESTQFDFLEIIKNIADRICWQIDYDGETTSDDISCFLYDSYIIMEAINPRLNPEDNILSSLILLLEEWEEDHEFVNKTLGLDPES